MPTKRNFDHVLIIMFENMYRSYIMENDYFSSLAEQGIEMRNYFGVMHPSQTNYISSIAAELCNVVDDDRPDPLPQNTIVDLIEQKGLSWKAYMDGYNPVTWSANLVPADEYPYVIKHNPFSSFSNVINSAKRWAKIDNQVGFYNDVAAGSLPNYAWFTPDMWNDGHYLVGTETEPEERAPALVEQQANWLRYFFGNLKFPGPDSMLPSSTLVVVTFDESDFEADWDKGKKYTYDGPNQIYTVLLGDNIKPGHQDEGYNHYSLIRTIENNFSLGTLGKNDAHSNWFRFLEGKNFTWSEAVPTKLPDAEKIAAAWNADNLVTACVTAAGVEIWYCENGNWELIKILNMVTPTALGLCPCPGGGTLELFYANPDGVFSCPLSDTGKSTKLVDGPAPHFSVHSAWENKINMLVWRDTDGRLKSICTHIDPATHTNEWSTKIVDLQQSTDGEFCLASIGPSLYLIYKQPGKNLMDVLSYNLADYNNVTYTAGEFSGPHDNTVSNAWNPSAFPVVHFSHMASPVTPGEEEPLTQPYRGLAPYAAATLDGVIHLVHRDADQSEYATLMTETFSISGIMTPHLPVSYSASDAASTSNGYGGLAEAGWSTQTKLDIPTPPDSAMAMAANQSGITLIYRTQSTGEFVSIVGNYV